LPFVTNFVFIFQSNKLLHINAKTPTLLVLFVRPLIRPRFKDERLSVRLKFGFLVAEPSFGHSFHRFFAFLVLLCRLSIATTFATRLLVVSSRFSLVNRLIVSLDIGRLALISHSYRPLSLTQSVRHLIQATAFDSTSLFAVARINSISTLPKTSHLFAFRTCLVSWDLSPPSSSSSLTWFAMSTELIGRHLPTLILLLKSRSLLLLFLLLLLLLFRLLSFELVVTSFSIHSFDCRHNYHFAHFPTCPLLHHSTQQLLVRPSSCSCHHQHPHLNGYVTPLPLVFCLLLFQSLDPLRRVALHAIALLQTELPVCFQHFFRLEPESARELVRRLIKLDSIDAPPHLELLFAVRHHTTVMIIIIRIPQLSLILMRAAGRLMVARTRPAISRSRRLIQFPLVARVVFDRQMQELHLPLASRCALFQITLDYIDRSTHN
jgi:hypothetical protein